MSIKISDKFITLETNNAYAFNLVYSGSFLNEVENDITDIHAFYKFLAVNVSTIF